jgi:hypothetical protein
VRPLVKICEVLSGSHWLLFHLWGHNAQTPKTQKRKIRRSRRARQRKQKFGVMSRIVRATKNSWLTSTYNYTPYGVLTRRLIEARSAHNDIVSSSLCG